MKEREWKIEIKDGIDTDIFIDGKRIPYVENFTLSQDVDDMDIPILKLSVIIVEPITISSTGGVIINKVEVDDDIALQIYELLKQKFEGK